MKRLLYISGLGANKRAFEKLDSFAGFKNIYINWIPALKKEPLNDYCLRIIKKYSITKEDKLIGLSFGGLVAQKIAEILNIKEVIIISSFRDKHDLKKILKIGLSLKLYRAIPNFKIPILYSLITYYLNSGGKKSRPILKEMLVSTDIKLLKWSIQKINEAKKIDSPLKLYSLIGSNDKILKLWRNTNSIVIEGGSHFMVYENANHISIEIQHILNNPC